MLPGPEGATLALLLLNLGGLPPLLGFFPKALVLWLLLQAGYTPLALILVLRASLRLAYYLRLMFSASLASSSPPRPGSPRPPTPLLVSLASLSGCLLLLPSLLLLSPVLRDAPAKWACTGGWQLAGARVAL